MYHQYHEPSHQPEHHSATDPRQPNGHPPTEDSSLQGSLLRGSIGRLLNAIDNAEAHVGRNELQFPRIAVFGDESTGKSSVLEAICRIPFPKGGTTTTRCPTLVRMLRKRGAKWSATVWLGRDRKGEQKVSDPHQVTQILRNLQVKNIQSANWHDAQFSDVPITVLVEDEHVVDLTLLDLPGYFIHQGINTGAADGDRVRIENLLMTHLRDERTIMLVVFKANQVFKTANIVNLIKKHEETIQRVLSPQALLAFRARSINCLTMCDIVSGPNASQEPAQDIETVLGNNWSFAIKPHGCFAVANNMSSRDGDVGNYFEKMERDRRLEEQFFDSVEPYNYSRFRKVCGIPNLIKKLSSILAEEISKCVPRMLNETGKALAKAKEELLKYGPVPGQDLNVKREFNNIVKDVLGYYQKLGDGDYEEFAAIAKEAPRQVLELGYLRRWRYSVFENRVRGERLKVGQKQYVKELAEKINRSRDGRLEESIPGKAVLISEIRRCVREWKKLADQLCDDIVNDALKCLDTIVDVRVRQYQQLPGFLKSFVKKMIKEQKEKAINRLEWHYIDEISRPDTRNRKIRDKIKLSKIAALGRDIQSTAVAYNEILESHFLAAEPRYTENVERTITTHIFDMPLNDSLLRNAVQEKFKYVFDASEILKGHKLDDLMKVRDDLEKERKKVERKISELESLREALEEHVPYGSIWEEEFGENMNGGLPDASHREDSTAGESFADGMRSADEASSSGYAAQPMGHAAPESGMPNNPTMPPNYPGQHNQAFPQQPPVHPAYGSEAPHNPAASQNQSGQWRRSFSLHKRASKT